MLSAAIRPAEDEAPVVRTVISSIGNACVIEENWPTEVGAGATPAHDKTLFPFGPRPEVAAELMLG
jgi:hypothetical protein